ncbi:MAG: RNA polymerase sigma factor [Acidimicrobiales bacterium]
MIRRRESASSSIVSARRVGLIEGEERQLEDFELSEELETLAEGARRGERPCLERLLALDYDRLHRVCWSVLRDEEAALDATQETVISVARSLPRFEGRSRYSTWAYRIAVNAALDELRRGKRRAVVALPESGRDDQRDLAAEENGGASLGVQSELENVVTDQIGVRAALSLLPHDQRTALLLRHFLDLDYDEIASILGVPIGTVRSRISRGRLALARVLGEDLHDDRASKHAGRNVRAGQGVEHDETP